MFGINSCFFMGRLTRDVTLKTSAEGNQYCYFTLAVNYPWSTTSDGQKKEREPSYINFSAGGGVAAAIAKRGKQGAWLLIWDAEARTKTNTKEVDGKIHVYRETEYRVSPGHFRGPFVLAPEKDADDSAAAQSAPAPTAKSYSPAPVANYGGNPSADLSDGNEYDYGDLADAEEPGVTEELPF